MSVEQVAKTLRIAVAGADDQTLRVPDERTPLRLMLRLPRAVRSNQRDLERLAVKGGTGQLVPLSEIGRWESRRVNQTIYHKNLQRVVYVFAECAGRPPAECVVDIQADRRPDSGVALNLAADASAPRPLTSRTYLANGGGIPWQVAEGIRVEFSGEGEWKITLDVFRDLGLAFGAAMLMIYIILVAQTGSFVIPLLVMLAIPLTLDPIFSGLGWSLIFGLIASTVFTLFVIPVGYWLLREGTER